MGVLRDLRALFRFNDRELKAVDVFADRRDEWATVAASLVGHTRWVQRPGFDVEDLETARRNALVFYGVGGIGKFTFSRGVTEHLVDSSVRGGDWPPLDAEVGRVLPVRIDLPNESEADFETLMPALRLAASELGEPMPAFDLAFQWYWERNHPGKPVEEYLRRRTWFSRFPGTRSLSGQMQSALSEVAQAVALPGTAGAVIGQTVGVVVRALREHR
ncbi:hypothetical protein [Streptomyces sp. 061-3]|uniref:hypothetical protein n=1 Tax=Streptomyces sp. 061-3 TaxID=2789268 RepID=UPI0039817646